ncbi:hypothetical protein Q7C36_021631 [Tachysurus vachellii]|uniref:LRAT domain-containing protein n=1 Tax=Tachysurus vachellii TaxID=175792 RepID=A0AA88IN87_TACVA|nr:lecithin retinol acyltransferase-like [Tachysurus vachellii]KAK2817698.1 hypothetical protein Q7C36_021631 [Tachysurus vachellii]
MFDSLLLLLQKTFLFAHWDFFSVVASRTEQPRRAAAEVPAQLQRGDLLEVPRTLFVHFGIYLGDGKVAHLIPDILPLLTRDELRVRAVVSNKRLLLGVLFRRAAVRVDTLEDFVYGARVLLINAMDGVLGVQPAPNEEVARTAETLIGAVRYSLLWNNCEHFVTFCRYGTGISLQTDKFCECLKSFIRDQRSVLATTVIGMFSILFLELSACTALPLLLMSFILWMAG